MPENEQTPLSNGWTQYQRLVLTELERHDANQTSLQKDIAELRLNLAKLETQLANGFATLQSNMSDIKSSGAKTESDIKTLDKARETHNLHLSAVQWKITAFSTAVASVLAILIELFLKKVL